MRLSTLILTLLPLSLFAGETKPLQALLITGGCCHDYHFQAGKLTEGTAKRMPIEWTVDLDPRKGTEGKIKRYDDPLWAEPFDVVVHNECFAKTKDSAYVLKITEAHKAGVPAVVIHCAMHTYRDTEVDDWRQMLGVTTRHHEHQSNYPVSVVAEDHPIMRRFPKNWTSPKDELYIIKKTEATTTPLATAKSEKNGESHTVFWVNQFGKARVFGTTFGHTNETFADPVFIDTVSRGMLWAAGKLNDNGTPAMGYGAPMKK